MKLCQYQTLLLNPEYWTTGGCVSHYATPKPSHKPLILSGGAQQSTCPMHWLQKRWVFQTCQHHWAHHKLARIRNPASFCWNLSIEITVFLSAIDVVTTERCSCLKRWSLLYAPFLQLRPGSQFVTIQTVSDPVSTLLNCP